MDDSMNNVTPINANEINMDEWVVMKTVGGGYLGKIGGNGITLSRVITGAREDNVKKFKMAVLDFSEKGGYIALKPCFDFLCPLRPVQTPGGGVAFQRDPVVVPFDFTTMEMPVYVKPSAVMFCADLQGKDKELYKNFIQQTLDLALRSRAQASGLELPGGLKGIPRG